MSSATGVKVLSTPTGMPFDGRSAPSVFWLSIASLWRRELVRFYRQRSRVIGVIGSPLVFWLVIGSGLGDSFQAAGEHKTVGPLQYFFPGTLVLILLFTSIFCMMSVIEDRREGFLQSVLVAPISRASLVLGKVLGGATLASLQGLLLLPLAPFVGIPLSLLQVLALAGVMVLVSFGLTALGFVFAWRLDSTHGFHALVNLFLIPMWLLSGALFPISGASSWVAWIMRLNPLTYSMNLLRGVLFMNDPGASATTQATVIAGAVTLGFGMLTFLASLRAASRNHK
jgi:ABC-2 type transport system permease protein